MQEAAETGQVFNYLTQPEVRFLDAAVARLIPADDLGPGGEGSGRHVLHRPPAHQRLGLARPQLPPGAVAGGHAAAGLPVAADAAEIYRAAIRETNVHCLEAVREGLRVPRAAAAGRGAERPGGRQDRARHRCRPSSSSGCCCGTRWKASSPIPSTAATATRSGWKLIGFPGVPASNYNDLIDEHNVPYRVEPVSILDIQQGKREARRPGLPEARAG